MANTQGLSDQEVTRLLSVDRADNIRTKSNTDGTIRSHNMPKGLLERQRMMDEFKGGDEFVPSAKVIRSSKRPIVKSSRNRGQSDELDKDSTCSELGLSNTGDVPLTGEIREKKSVSFGGPVIISESIIERPITFQEGGKYQPPKVSRFKMKQQQKQSQMNRDGQAGFPSFDIPVGTLTRNGGKIAVSVERTTSKNIQQVQNVTVDAQSSEADKIIANMSKDEIHESLEEIKSILSHDAIQFLKNRKKQTEKHDVGRVFGGKDNYDAKHMTQNQTSMSSHRVSRTNASLEEKEQALRLISSIQTEEQLEEAFLQATMGDHVGTNGFDDNESEIEKATKLLRSTAPRQRTLAAKTLCDLLESRVQSLSEQTDPNWCEDSFSYPDILPVALRCLLDTPSPWKNMQLLSFVLRSLNSLVTLFSHPEHRISLQIISCNNLSFGHADNVLQQDFMCDTVPISIGSELYYRGKEEASTMETTALDHGCYATHASTDSVKSDATAFYTDPAWTLLSKMRLIPCISYILSTLSRMKQKSECDAMIISKETVQAICGILSSMCIRSTGAAVAIAQHKDLLPSLFALTLEPDDSGHSAFVVDTTFAMPVIYLSCVLCGQSRNAAEAIETAVMDAVVYIIASDPTNQQEFQLQQWCLILWRKMLRYGLGLTYLPIILPISAKSLTANSSSLFSLAAEYYSAFSVICQCVKVAKSMNMSQNDAENVLIDDSVKEILAMSGVWFSSHVQSCLKFFVNSIDTASRHSLKLMSAKLRFLTAYFDAASPTDIIGGMTASSRVTFVSIVPADDVILALANVARSKVVEDAARGILASAQGEYPGVMQDEAARCAFIDAFFSSLCTLIQKMNASRSNHTHNVSPVGEANLEELVAQVCNTSVDIIQYLFSQSADNWPRSRILWTNNAASSIFKLISIAASISQVTRATVIEPQLETLQSLLFYLIGRLQHGDEATAVEIFKYDLYFTMGLKSSKLNNAYSPSVLQDFMAKELSSGPLSRIQLDHSYKLYGHSGILEKGSGHFGLKSLRVESDLSSRNLDTSLYRSVNDGLILPFGNGWLWKLISGVVVVDHNHADTDDTNSKAWNIVKATLRLLLHIETSGMSFANSLHPGAKIYYLINTCLYPETIIRDEEYDELFLELFNLYQTESLKDGYKCAQAFIMTCYNHSSHFRQYSLDGADYEYLIELFYGSNERNNMGLSSKDFKAIDDFIDDICDAFVDFGAQYDSFVYAIRYLLTPFMPLRIRIRILEKLRDILHLLTTKKESTDGTKQSLKQSLQHYFVGGLPFLDQSQRDDALLLDTLASLLKGKSFDLGQRQEGFFYYFAVGVLARNFASNAVKCECGVSAMKRRFDNLNVAIWEKISEIAEVAIKEKCASAEELTTIVINAFTKEASLDGYLDFDATVQKLRSL